MNLRPSISRAGVLALLLTSVLALSACSSSSSSSSSAAGGTSTSTTHFAKTKFVLHAGLAFGAFHRWIYKPYRAGVLSHPLLHKLAFLKALAAGAFVVHEVKLARADAAQSRLLSHVVVPLAALGSSVALIRTALSHHKVDGAQINSANSSVSAASSASSAAGQPITETTSGSGL
jgi:hypothetical protein